MAEGAAAAIAALGNLSPIGGHPINWRLRRTIG